MVDTKDKFFKASPQNATVKVVYLWPAKPPGAETCSFLILIFSG
jgi:hypothetical protein